MRRLRTHIAHIVGLLALPYGYTIAIWTVGHLVTNHFQTTGVWEIGAFLLGAVAAFLLLAVVAYPVEQKKVPPKLPSVIVLNALPLVAERLWGPTEDETGS